MRSPYGLEIVESCVACKLRLDGMFCDLPLESLKAFEALKYSATFPKGAMLFVEGQSPRGVYIICSGRVKLSTSSSDGKTLITHIAQPGETLGLSATISNKPYEVTAETLDPCQINFIRREEFLNFLSERGDLCLRAAEHLSNNYHQALDQTRALGLSSSAASRLAGLILEWCAVSGKPSEQGISLKLTLTHEEIAQMIGLSRETVTRLFSDFKHERIIHMKGATLLVRDKAALETLVIS
jgi:CRP/FNR family transcriptional regulator